MRFRSLTLAILFLSLFCSSYVVQSNIFKPTEAAELAKDYRQVKSKVCVNSIRSNRLDVSVVAGELPGHAKGLITANERYSIGDCFLARFTLRPSSPLDRNVFSGNLREVLGPVEASSDWLLINRIRSRFQSLEGDASNLVAGLALGIDEGLSNDFLSAMKATGLTHLTAVSGANCAIVIGLVWVFLRRFPIHKSLRTAVALGVLAFYVKLVGNQPSVLRAAFMVSAVYLSLELGKRLWLPWVLASSSALLLILDPWLIIDYGFWLSILATYGLVTLTPSVALFLEGYLPKQVALLLAATFAAQLWCLPILATLQGGFTTYSVLANLLVEPVVALVTVLGLLAASAGVVLPFLFAPLLTVASFFASWIVLVASAFSSLPVNLLPLPTGVLGTAILIVFVLIFSKGVIKARSFLASLLCLSLVSGWLVSGSANAVGSFSWPPNNWVVVSCDVGQGDATVIASKGSVAVLDTGKDPKLIDSCLDRLGIREINLLVLTHYDADHVAGLAGALRGREVHLSLVSKFPDSRPLALVDRKMLDEASNQVIEATGGLTGNLGDFRWAIISSLGSDARDSNEGSLGVLFESSTLSIYTLADLNAEAQCRMRTFTSAVPVIVKVSHHGSSDQCENLYQSISPDLALISVGKDNSYGHPTQKTLKLLQSAGSKISRTDLLGSLAIVQNPNTLNLTVTGSG